MTGVHKCLLAVLASTLFRSTVVEAQTTDDGITVAVETRDGLVIVDATLNVPVTPCDVWRVLTDYEQMPRFLPNILQSRIVARAGNTLQVAQQGKAYYGPLSFSYDVLQEVTLEPYSRIRSSLIRGSLKQARGSTRLVPVGIGTRIIFHSESDPNLLLPSGIKRAFAARAVREHVENLRSEMMRRKTETHK